MTSMNGEAEVLRTDERGRVRVPAERRNALLEEFERSGISGAKFARLAGVKYATFANWVQARRKARRTGVLENGPLHMVEAVVEAGRAGAGSCGLLVELPGGGCMRIESPMQLRLAAELLCMMAQSARSRC
jgi:transposase-like protein